MKVAVDQADRDRIRTALDESLFIEAGAGTGKTSSLIDRLVALVDSGVELRNAAAITFTEAAAAELKDRLRQEVERHAASASRGTPEHARWQRALHQLDAAAIQTLHAFAQRILATHPLEAGLPPGFQLLDAVQSSMSFDDRWRDFLDEFFGDNGPQDLVEVLYGLDSRFDGLRKAARALHENWDRLEDIKLPATPRPPADATNVIDLLDELCRYIGRNTASDRMEEELAPVPAALAAITKAGNTFALMRALNFPVPRRNYGRAANWPPGVIESVREAAKTLREERDGLRKGLAAWCAEALLSRLAKFALDYADERRRAGTLDFHDLLTLARDLLRGNDEVRAALHRRFTHVLIDEFQDTDPLQIEIASLIVRPEDCPGSVPWHDAPVPSGSLVVVGDPKQSIYRFRRADMQLYLKASETLPLEHVNLVQNWRSDPSILDWVNEVFATLIGPEADAEKGQPAYIGLAPGRDAAGQQPQVYWFGDERANADAAREAEAEAVAQALLKIRSERWPVQRKGADRDARLADVAILIPRRIVLPYLERVFESRGIPYRVESRSLLYETQEIIDLGHVLTALSDPTDEVAIVAALRSPAFACSDRHLLEWRDAEGRWNYTRSASDSIPKDHPVAESLAWLNEQHDFAAREPVNRVVEMVIRERRLMELAFAFRRPRERWQRYRFVLEQARAFASSPDASLRGFVVWMRRQRDEAADVRESAVPEPDDDAVRIMTVHASKGLEFPVVLLAGLGSEISQFPAPVIWDDDGRPQLSVGKVKTAGYDDAKDLEARREEAEDQRLLYVAATRARDHLLVSLYRGGRDKNHAARLVEVMDGRDHLWRHLDLSGDAADMTAERRTVEMPALNPDEWLERRTAAIEERQKGPAVAATAIARLLREAESDGIPAEESGDESEPWKRGRAGTHIGRAVHAVLQTVDLGSGEGIESAARAQAIAEGIPARQPEIEVLVRMALGSAAVREAVESGRYWREVFVATELDGHLLEGFIDLLYERDGALVVVDYKTDALRGDAALEEALERYGPQAAAYALALQRQVGRPVAECRFVFISERGARERTVADLEAAIARVQGAVAALP